MTTWGAARLRIPTSRIEPRDRASPAKSARWRRRATPFSSARSRRSSPTRCDARPGEGQEGAVPIEMPKGSVVFFTQGVWHRQGDRTEPGDRVTLHAHFNRGILRSLEPKKADVQMLHRNSPRLAEMLGEDDWFDKMSAAGLDYRRFNFMQQLLAFTEKQSRQNHPSSDQF